MSNVLETRGLTVSFGGVHANNQIDLVVPTGAFVGLIGPNGAGKTTFIDAVTGYVPTASGVVEFDGSDIGRLPPHRRAQLGLVRTFQSLELFEDLSIRDNMLASAQRTRWYTIFADLFGRSNAGSELNETIDWALDLLGLSAAGGMLPTELSHGRRKLVAVARALASRPKLVLLDEPAAGLDTTESEELGRHLRTLLDHDMSVFLIDHDMGLVLSSCDLIYVLEFGQVIASGTPDEIRQNDRVIEAYLGTKSTTSTTRPAE